MRKVQQPIIDAFKYELAQKSILSANIYKTRNTISNASINYQKTIEMRYRARKKVRDVGYLPGDWTMLIPQSSTIRRMPLSESAYYDGYTIITALVDQDGSLYGSTDSQYTCQNLADEGIPFRTNCEWIKSGRNPRSRPAIVRMDDSNIRIASMTPGHTIEISDYSISEGYDLETDPFGRTVRYKYLYSIGGSEKTYSEDKEMHLTFVDENTLVGIYIYEGGVGVSVYQLVGGTWTKLKSTKRFMHPTYLWGSSYNDYDFLNHSGAVKKGDDIFVYISDVEEGSCIGTRYSLTSKSFTDTFTAIPSDLSIFRVTHAYVAPNNTIHIVGQFKRVDPDGYFSSEYIYNLDCSSINGRNFSLDKTTSFGYGSTTLEGGVRTWVLHTYAEELLGDYETIYYNLGMGVKEYGIYSSHGESCKNVRVSQNSCISYAGSPSGEGYLQISNNDNLSLVDTGNRIVIRIGVHTNLGMDWFVFSTGIINKITTSTQDGNNQMTLEISPYSAHKLSSMTYPYYMEIESKQSYRSLTEREISSNQTNDLQITQSTFIADFWDKNGPLTNNAIAFNHAATLSEEIWSRDFLLYPNVVTYPKVNNSTVTIDAYCWSRPGGLSITSGTEPASPAGNVNDTISLKIKYKRNGIEMPELFLTSTTTANYPKRTYPGTDRSGSYPITFETTSFAINDEITAIAMRFTAGVYETTFYPERVEIQGVIFQINASTGSIWEYSERVVNNHTYELASLTQPGASAIRLSSRPYTAFNFEAVTFGRVAGSNSWIGSVGLADNSNNYICAKNSVSKLQIIKVRNGEETVLAETTRSPWGGVPDFYVMLQHHDGIITASARLSGYSYWADTITYEWTYADGPLATDKNIMHMGSYAEKEAPYFVTSGFSSESVNIPIAPGDNSIDEFPSSGEIIVGDQIFAYTGKISSSEGIMGPYQARNITNFPAPSSLLGHLFPSGNAMEINKFDYRYISPNETWTITGLLGTQIKSYRIADGSYSINFRPTMSESGTSHPQKERCRIWSYDMSNDYVGTSSKCYITNGLTGVTKSDSTRDYYNVSEGSCVFLYDATQTVDLYSFYGSTGSEDFTLEDLIEKIAHTAGANVLFPGDKVIKSIVLTSNNRTKVSGVQYVEPTTDPENPRII